MRFALIAVTLILVSALAISLKTGVVASPVSPQGMLFLANQFEHTALLIDLATRRNIFVVGVDINGHEVAVSPNGRLGYVPIYGNSGVGKPGTDGSTIEVVDLQTGRTTDIINLPKPVRPHSAKFGPDGLLYVTAELANAVYALDVHTHKVVGEIPTGKPEAHMLVISADGKRAYTANVASGTISVLDLEHRSLVTTIAVADKVQRLSLSPDGHHLYTHDQDNPRIAVIDTTTNTISGWIAIPTTVYSSAVTPDGRRLVANSASGKLLIVDLPTQELVQYLDIPQAVGAIAISTDGAYAFITCPQAGTIEVMNLRDNVLEKPLMLTKGVDGIAWLPAHN